jgi:hypothetical protein
MKVFLASFLSSRGSQSSMIVSNETTIEFNTSYRDNLEESENEAGLGSRPTTTTTTTNYYTHINLHGMIFMKQCKLKQCQSIIPKISHKKAP